MKQYTLFLFAALCLGGCANKTDRMNELVCDPRFIVLAGQSNGVGFAPGAQLPADLAGPITGAKIFYGDSQGLNWANYTWQTLQYNVNNDGTAGKTSQFHGYFGPELRLMKLLIKKYGGEMKMAKVGEGGTSLGFRVIPGQPGRRNWSPDADGQLFDISTAYENAAVASLPGQKPPAAYIWVQGEDDASGADYGEGPIANAYQANLTEFISLKRAQFGYTIPFVIVRLGNLQTLIPETQRNIIRTAQAYVASNVPKCYLVDMDNQGVQSDNIHYTGTSYDVMAQRIFNILKKIIPINLAKNVPGVVVAHKNMSFASAGISSSNTKRIYKVGTTLQSYEPNRLINPIENFVINQGYYFEPKEDMDLRDVVSPPNL